MYFKKGPTRTRNMYTQKSPTLTKKTCLHKLLEGPGGVQFLSNIQSLSQKLILSKNHLPWRRLTALSPRTEHWRTSSKLPKNLYLVKKIKPWNMYLFKEPKCRSRYLFKMLQSRTAWLNLVDLFKNSFAAFCHHSRRLRRKRITEVKAKNYHKGQREKKKSEMISLYEALAGITD